MARKVLIVEDETNIADLNNLYLKKEGYETMVANDGGKALELYPEAQEPRKRIKKLEKKK